VDPATVKDGMQVSAAFGKLGPGGEASVIRHRCMFRLAT